MNLTPMMKQYYDLKEQYKGMLLFFRMGDFYEMFDNDAVIASKALGITLTCRDKNSENPTPLCGVPYHSADQYLAKLIKKGFKVAICEQTEDPKKAVGIVKRDVVKVITPGLVSDLECIDEKKNNFLVALKIRNPNALWIGAVDITTATLKIGQALNYYELIQEILKLNPSEILIDSTDRGIFEQLTVREPTLKSIELSESPLYQTTGQSLLDKKVRQYFVENSTLIDLLETSSLTSLLGLILCYLEETQKDCMPNLNNVQIYQTGYCLEIDESSRRNLDIFTNQSQPDSKYALVPILDKTITPMGGRLFKQWFLYPLLHSVDIQRRLQAVDELFSFSHIQTEIRRVLRSVGDLERLCSKITLKTANPRDVLKVMQTMDVISELKSLLSNTTAELLRNVNNDLIADSELVTLISSSLQDEPPLIIRQGGIIRQGFNPELDRLRDISQNGKLLIAQLEQKEKELTNIPTLKIRYNNVFGYYIEISKGKSDAAPDRYIRKQTLSNAERFFTPELKQLEEEILSANDKIVELEYQLFQKLLQSLTDKIQLLLKNAQAIALLDVLNAFAYYAVKNNYVRPDIDDSGEIQITEGRHPIIEESLKDQMAISKKMESNNPHSSDFVPNDVLLNHNSQELILITGPNMAGKSTIMRQVALITLMAQCGSFVPAVKARISPVDKIFTRVGASDNLAKGYSTFMVEMLETSHILKNATRNSLILLDEIGRGTSTYDGVSIAWSVVEDLHDRIGVKTLFATHYHELTELAILKPRIANFQVLVEECNDEIRFLRKLMPGAVNRSYGIAVAKLAGLPESVVTRAFDILHRLEKHQPAQELSNDNTSEKQLTHFNTDKRINSVTENMSQSNSTLEDKLHAQMDMFGDDDRSTSTDAQFIDELKTILHYPINKRTPLDTVVFVAKIQKKLADKGLI